jgi:hypothetical protein
VHLLNTICFKKVYKATKGNGPTKYDLKRSNRPHITLTVPSLAKYGEQLLYSQDLIHRRVFAETLFNVMSSLWIIPLLGFADPGFLPW